MLFVLERSKDSSIKRVKKQEFILAFWPPLYFDIIIAYIGKRKNRRKNQMTQVQLAEAIHVTTHWYRYRQSYVTLCNRVLMQRGLKLKGGENVS